VLSLPRNGGLIVTNFNILFTSAGRRVALLRDFRASLAELGVSGRMIATDISGTAPAGHVADLCLRAPRVTSSEYVSAVKEICREHGVKLVVPLIDTELHVLAPHREEFARIGTELLVSSTRVTSVCLDKRRTHDFFIEAGVRTPRLLDIEATELDPNARYPFFMKPVEGSCSVGARRVNDKDELTFFSKRTDRPLLQELVHGDEYTMDILVDFRGRTRCVVPRLRMETRAGEISKGVTVKNHELIEAGRRVVDALREARGCITVQCFLPPGQPPVFIEINPRFGGGFPLSSAAGAHYPRWIIEWVLGREPEITIDGWADGTVMLRYDDAVFVRREDIL
jgi:carbamoyl-phosphate synthase large subunit